MKVIPWEDNLVFSDLQKDVLIGCLLGDGRLECRSESGAARFRVHHAESQREFLFWKYNHFQELVRRAPWRTEWLDKRNGRIYGSWFFHTITTLLFKPFYERFYREGIKIVPRDIGKYLTPRAMAVWVMDDGCRTQQDLILNTQSFTLDEQRFLLEEIKRRYEVRGTINKDRNNYRLRFGRLEAKTLSEIIAPYILESLITKIVPVSTVSRLMTRTGDGITPLQHARSRR